MKPEFHAIMLNLERSPKSVWSWGAFMLVFDKCHDVLQQFGQEAHMPIMCVFDFNDKYEVQDVCGVTGIFEIIFPFVYWTRTMPCVYFGVRNRYPRVQKTLTPELDNCVCPWCDKLREGHYSKKLLWVPSFKTGDGIVDTLDFSDVDADACGNFLETLYDDSSEFGHLCGFRRGVVSKKPIYKEQWQLMFHEYAWTACTTGLFSSSVGEHIAVKPWMPLFGWNLTEDPVLHVMFDADTRNETYSCSDMK
jgi:hypothetical protein